MEQVIFCDIDGCLNDGKHTGFDLATLSDISAMIADLAARGTGFCLCTGRPQPYGEAMAQVLDLQMPFVCENGAMIFEPEFDRATPLVPNAALTNLKALRVVLENEGYVFEPGNECSVSIAGLTPSGDPSEFYAAECAALAKQHAQFGLNWTSSSTSIDITPRGVSKQTGVAYLLDRFGVNPKQALAIGDGNNDLKMLAYVGHPMCPANAGRSVQAKCETVASFTTAKGTAELLRGIIKGEGG